MSLKNKLMESLERQKILVNPRILRDDYIPDHLLFRENEMDTLVNAVSNLLKALPGFDVFVFGPPATGKTHAVKLLVREFNDLASEKNYPARGIYVSARGKTLTMVWSEIYQETVLVLQGTMATPLKRMDDAMRKFIELVNSSPVQGIFLVVDEIDRMLPTRYKNPEALLISMLTRLNEMGIKKNVNIIIVSNELRRIISSLDDSTRSKFTPIEVFFREYDARELALILEDRAKKAFAEGTLDEGVIKYLSAYIYRHNRDLRYAFYILLTAGEYAERHNIKKIDIPLIESLLEIAKERLLRDRIASLSYLEVGALLASLLAQRVEGGEVIATLADAYFNLQIIGRIIGSSDLIITRTYFKDYVLRVLKSRELIDIVKVNPSGGRGRSNEIVFIEDPLVMLKITYKEFVQRFHLTPQEFLEILRVTKDLRNYSDQIWKEIESALKTSA